MTRPLILVSNDDSIHASGLQALIEIAQHLGDVVVVAPAYPQSGMSHALTSNTPIRVHKVKEEIGLTLYSCTGTPVDCIKLGINRLVPRLPDLILTGINHGSNSSISILYSGTMGAAAEGALYDIPAIGFSLCDYSSTANFSACIPLGTQIARTILATGMPKGIALNVNFPKLPLEEIKGVKICRQHKAVWRENFEARVDPHGCEYFWLTGTFVDLEPNATDSDEAALAEGYVAVVPVHFDFTSYSHLNSFNHLATMQI